MNLQFVPVPTRPINRGSFHPPISKNVYYDLIKIGGDHQFTLLELVSDIELKQHDYDFRENIRKQIASCLLESFPQSEAYIYGSSKNGIGFNGSDLDIVVDTGFNIWNSNNTKEVQLDQISHTVDKIARCIKKARLANQITKIPHARVPLVKFQENENGVEIDVSFKSCLPICNSDLIRVYCNSHNVVRPFMMIIKYWAKMQKVARSAQPKELLTNYALSLMMIFFLMNRPDPIIPCVGLLQEEYNLHNPGKKKFANGWECSFAQDASEYASKCTQISILELIYEFFDFYGCLNFADWVICPLMGRLIPRSDFDQRTPSFDQKYLANFYDDKVPFRLSSPLSIQDPFELCKSVSGVYDLDALRMFQIKCLRAAEVCKNIINNNLPLIELFEFIYIPKIPIKTAPREYFLMELHKKIKANKSKPNGVQETLMKGLTPILVEDSDDNSADSDSESSKKRNVTDKNKNYKVYTKSELENIFDHAMNKFKKNNEYNNSNRIKESGSVIKKEEIIPKDNTLLNIWNRLSLKKFRNLDYSFCVTVNVKRVFTMDIEGNVLTGNLVKAIPVVASEHAVIKDKRFLNKFVKFVMIRIFKWSIIKETIGLGKPKLESVNSNFSSSKLSPKNESRLSAASDTKSKVNVMPNTLKIQADAANSQASPLDSQIKMPDSSTTDISDSIIKISDKETNNLDAQVGNTSMQPANLDLNIVNKDLKAGTIDQPKSLLKRKRCDSFEMSEKKFKKTENSETVDKSDVERNGDTSNDEIKNLIASEHAPESAIPDETEKDTTQDKTEKDAHAISTNEKNVHTDADYFLLKEYSLITYQNVWNKRLEIEENMEYGDNNDCVESDKEMTQDEGLDVSVGTVQDDKLTAKNLDTNLPHPLAWELNLTENIISKVSSKDVIEHTFKVKIWKNNPASRTYCIALEPVINENFDWEDFEKMFKCFSKVFATSAHQIFY